MIVLLDNRGLYDKALLICDEAVRFHPNDSSLLFNFANVLGKMKKFEEAEVRFKAAIRQSEEAAYFANLGVLYHRWKRFGDARAAYLRALELNPDMASTKDNLKALLGKL